MIIKINLQLFSGEKTEKATPRKKEDARKKGQVLQSKDLTSALTLLVSLLVLKYLGKYMLQNSFESLQFFKNNFINKDISNTMTGYRIMIYIGYFIIKGSMFIVLINAIVAFISSYAQVGSLFTVDTLKFKLERINPLEGFKKLVSLRALVDFIKSSLKLIILSFVAYGFVKDNIFYVFKPLYLNKYQFSYALFDLSIKLGIKLAFVLFILSLFDYLYQWYEFEKGLKMSKEDIKQEYKQSEGDPQIKSKIKEKQRQIAMKRMMQDIPKADVIITNPTHFAIAIRYDDKMYDAPYVIGKGKNLVALKIREKAKENNVPIVENKPLARQLYDSVSIGDLIPSQLYEAIAEILAYVYSLKNGIK